MKIGVLGTGMAGETLATKLVECGHEVMMGSRDAQNPKATAWAQNTGTKASAGSFQDAAKFGELVINCTMGSASLEALKSAGEKNLNGKVIIDIANALDFSKGMPPGLTVNVASDSLAEHIQKAFPKAKVVKSLNTVTASVMVNPAALPGDHVVFLSGNDDAAKQKVAQLLENDFGWKKKNIVDLGDITTSRAQEALIVPWLRLWGKFGSPMFNWQLVTSTKPK